MEALVAPSRLIWLLTGVGVALAVPSSSETSPDKSPCFDPDLSDALRSASARSLVSSMNSYVYAASHSITSWSWSMSKTQISFTISSKGRVNISGRAVHRSEPFESSSSSSGPSLPAKL